MENPRFQIIDARPTASYLAGHIPNAVSASLRASEYLSHGVDTSYGGGVDLFTDPTTVIPFQDGPQDMLEGVIGSRLGISNDSIVVVYDDGAHHHATRFFWTLTRHGFDNISILNGGLNKWVTDGHQVTKRVPRIKPTKFKIVNPDESIIVDTDWVLDNLYNPEVMLVAAYAHTWYTGEYLGYSRRGHLPGSISIPYTYNFSSDGTWKPIPELRAMYENLGVSRDKTIVTYCGGNPSSTCAYFTLRYLLGYPNVKSYSKSVVEWCYDPRGLPLDSYANPNMLRDPEWVNWWAGERIQRLVTEPEARVIDARSHAEYQSGHLPFSVNLPATEICAAIGKEGHVSPLALKRIEAMLGGIGIHNETEVVVYDNNNAYLATFVFWMLDYLGHRKISVLNGGLAAWQKAGLNITVEPTIIRKPKASHKFDIAISMARYHGTVKPDKLALPNWVLRNQGDPDKLFINNSPSADPDISRTLKAVHIPWPDNVGREGSFKSAGELSNMYEQSGVSRLKEVVCCSRDSMAASHTYFTLKLIGYPRVRLCRSCEL